jgi:hypothetical protein
MNKLSSILSKLPTRVFRLRTLLSTAFAALAVVPTEECYSCVSVLRLFFAELDHIVVSFRSEFLGGVFLSRRASSKKPLLGENSFQTSWKYLIIQLYQCYTSPGCLKLCCLGQGIWLQHQVLLPVHLSHTQIGRTVSDVELATSGRHTESRSSVWESRRSNDMFCLDCG